MKSLEDYSPRVHTSAIEKLEAMLDGTDVDTGMGICGNLDARLDRLHSVCGYAYAAAVFRALDMDDEFPLGMSLYRGDLWGGDKGIARRDLARKMIECINTQL